MAGTLADQATLSKDSAFIDKCRAELIKQAQAIDTGTAGHKSTPIRVLASAILDDPDNYAQRAARLIAFNNATIGAAAPAVPVDGDMAFVVGEVFDLLGS